MDITKFCYIDLINKELPGARYALDVRGFMHFYCGDVEGILAHLKQNQRGTERT